jgi:hypothetical protein
MAISWLLLLLRLDELFGAVRLEGLENVNVKQRLANIIESGPACRDVAQTFQSRVPFSNPALEPGDRKVARTRRLESLRYVKRRTPFGIRLRV